MLSTSEANPNAIDLAPSTFFEVLSSPTVCALHCIYNRVEQRLSVGLLVVSGDLLPVAAGKTVQLTEIPLTILTQSGVQLWVQLPAIQAAVTGDLVLAVVKQSVVEQQIVEG